MRRINLATRPLVNQRWFWLAGSLLSLAALLFTGYVIIEGTTTWQQRMTTRGRLSELARERTGLRSRYHELEDALSNPATRELLEQNAFLNRVIRQKAFSWGRFFDRLAANLPRRARVLSVSPKLLQDGRVEVWLKLGGESASDIHRFMQALEQEDSFSQVVLQSQQQEDGSRDNVTAQLKTVYREGE